MNLDVFRRFRTSEDWKEVQRELDIRITAAEKDLRRCKPEDLVKLQAKIEVYEEMKNLPGQVLDREE